MNQDCLKLTTYFAEHDKTGRRFLADALLDCYGRHQFATSVLLRGAEGFGSRQQLQTQRLLTLSEDLPMVTVAVDTRQRIEQALAEVAAVTSHGLVTLERAACSPAESRRCGCPRGWPRQPSSPSTWAGVTGSAVVRPSWPSSTCCTAMGSMVRPCCWGWTAPPTASGNGHASSAATPACR